MEPEYPRHPYQHQWGNHSAGYDPSKPKLRRPTTDYGSTLAQWMRYRKPRDKRNVLLEAERPSYSYIVDMLPPLARPERAADSIPVKHLHSSLNKAKFPINVVLWTPEGRRLLTASSSGEFTLWNGMAFNFELIMQAHESAVRAACYSHSDDWLISADQDGIVKYWQPNFNNVKEIQAHNETIRGIAFAPTDSKFVTGGDDAALKIFDFAGGTEELTLTGHQWEIRCLDWHPTKGLLVSGSKDHSVKLWDPRSGRCLTTLNSSKNQVSRTLFEPTHGELLATSGRDHIIRIFDLRMMKDVFQLRGHDTEVTAIQWHPQHRNMLSSGGHAGAMHHYLLDEQNPPPGVAPTLSPYDSPDPGNAPPQTIFPAHSINHAHEPTGPIWSLSWHPLGHILASGSNDRITRFWTRPRPGDTSYLNDRFHIGQQAAEERGTYSRRDDRKQAREAEELEALDEAEGLTEQGGPPGPPQLPGIALPGIASNGQPQLPGFGAAAPNPSQSGLPLIPPPPPLAAPNMMPPLPFDPAQLEKLKEMFGGVLPPLPPPPPNGAPFPIPGFPLVPGALPPLPGALAPPLPGQVPPPFPGMLGMPGVPPPPPGFSGANGVVGNGAAPPAADSSGVRRRGPLPSQEEMLRTQGGRGR